MAHTQYSPHDDDAITRTPSKHEELDPTILVQDDNIPPTLDNEKDDDRPSTEQVIPPEPSTRSSLQTVLIMFALCFAVFLAAIDTVILTTALPTVAADIHASDAGFAWIGSSFLLSNAASMPFWGKTSDIFGRKPVLIIANAIFLAGSLISALAPTLGVLLIGRAVQGLGAGGLTVLANIIVSDLFAMRMRGLMLALLGTVWSLASAIGPVIGGLLAQKVSWRWCFWLNLPCEGLSLILIAFLLKVHNPRTPLLIGLRAIDWLGTLTITIGTVMLLLGLQLGGVSFPWRSPTVISLLTSGTLTLALFLFIEARIATHPLMPLRIFHSRSNAATLLVVLVHGICYIAVAYFLPIYLQSVLGFPPILSGAWTLVSATTLAITTAACGIYMHASGRYLPLIPAGLAALITGLALLSTLPAHLSVPRLVTFQIAVSLGIAPLFQAPLLALQSQLTPADVAAGTATFGFTRTLAAAVSLAAGQAVFQAGMGGRAPGFIDAGIPADLAGELAGGSSVASTRILHGLTEMQARVVREAQAQSLGHMWVFYAGVAGVGMVAAVGVRERRMGRERHVEVKTGLDRGRTRDGEEDARGVVVV